MGRGGEGKGGVEGGMEREREGLGMGNLSETPLSQRGEFQGLLPLLVERSTESCTEGEKSFLLSTEMTLELSAEKKKNRGHPCWAADPSILNVVLFLGKSWAFMPAGGAKGAVSLTVPAEATSRTLWGGLSALIRGTAQAPRTQLWGPLICVGLKSQDHRDFQGHWASAY